ncbi:LytTR family DNA-binding domain-containing protein [Aureitalea marina]|uniref:HTH LytTR-type domain-containing protein n=1 Tax=Aureitalea marina TaxID=930804 RepID=A0A2S7KSS7_9FLAO|nr:LytTR family DNA-binding domain-containing protein [Aureitalea marina]PQB05667.1 hypothetical protein BST85_12740 [Aureitalea marina]
MNRFNRPIAFTVSWKKIIWIGLIIGALLAGIVIFLKPYGGEDYDMPYGTWRLAGYIFPVLAALLLLHPAEMSLYKRQNKRWYILNELFYLFISSWLCISFSSIYNFYVVNDLSGYNLSTYLDFLWIFAPPYLPIIVPLLALLRANYGSIVIDQSAPKESSLVLEGENKSEKIELEWKEFVMAQAQQNYVRVLINRTDGLEEQLIRSSLSRIAAQVPQAVQVHRSYLVNLDYLERVQGNARKREMTFNISVEPIPVSPKYFEALGSLLSDSSR